MTAKFHTRATTFASKRQDYARLPCEGSGKPSFIIRILKRIMG